MSLLARERIICNLAVYTAEKKVGQTEFQRRPNHPDRGSGDPTLRCNVPSGRRTLAMGSAGGGAASNGLTGFRRRSRRLCPGSACEPLRG
jgi:hypothetical protein